MKIIILTTNPGRKAEHRVGCLSEACERPSPTWTVETVAVDSYFCCRERCGRGREGRL